MNTQIEQVLSSLMVIADCCFVKLTEQEKAMLASSAKPLLEEGWEPHEIVQLLRNVENVNPTLPEDVALARMRTQRAKVEARLTNNAN